MKGAEIIVSNLEKYGVKYIFGLPGDATYFFRALRRSTIKFITVHDERTAGFAAGVYGHLSGMPGVAYVSRGPGGTNLISGVACSFLEEYPALYIMDQQSRKDCVDRRVHMFVDFESVYEPVSKGVDVVWHAKDISKVLPRAWTDVQRPPMGPRCLVVPQDVLNEDAEPSYLEPDFVMAEKDESEDAVENIARHIAKDKHAVLILGPGVRKFAFRELKKFVDHLSLPFFTTRHAKGIIDERHPLNYGIMRKGNLSMLSSEFNLVITIGHGVPDKNYLWVENEKKITHINVSDHPCVRTGWFSPNEEYIVDWPNFFSLSENFIPKGTREDKFSVSSDFWQEREREALGQKSGKNLLWHLLGPKYLGKVVKDDDLLIPDTGLNKIYALSAYRAPGPNFLCSSAFSSIGFAIPASIGASYADPERNIIAICGDGGFLMSVAELETIKRLNLPVKILVLADGAYGYIKERQHEAFGSDLGVNFGIPDFGHLAKAFDLNYVAVRRQEDLRTAKKAISSRKTSVLVVLYQQYNY